MLHSRLPRWDFAHRSYFLGCCLDKRRRLFEAPDVAERLVDLYAAERDHGTIALHGYVVMPDHYHVLLTLHDEPSISALVRRVHSFFSRALRANQPVTGRVWQRRFYDHVIRDEQDWYNCLLYLHENPVRGGLVADGCDYRWSSCRFWRTGEGPVRCDGGA